MAIEINLMKKCIACRHLCFFDGVGITCCEFDETFQEKTEDSLACPRFQVTDETQAVFDLWDSIGYLEEKMIDWKSVNDEKPKEECFVLLSDGNIIFTGTYLNNLDCFDIDECDECNQEPLVKPKYWAEINMPDDGIKKV